MQRSMIDESFIERMGGALEAQGLPRIAGQVYALLILTDQPLTLEEIASELGVSAGSASTNSRLLESLDLVERFTPKGERRVRHRVHAAPFPPLLQGSITRFEKLASIIHDARTQLPRARISAAKRLASVEEAFALCADSLRQSLDAVSANSTGRAESVAGESSSVPSEGEE
jgi:DNA-binding transcriptional regulator GbsR (MarR family)